MHINEAAGNAYLNSKAHGFYNAPNQNISEKLMLIVSELSEAMECLRTNAAAPAAAQVARILAIEEDALFQDAFKSLVKDSFGDELADAIIRIFDLAIWQGVDIELHVQAKMRFNALRPYKHGNKQF